jgi:fatty acid desaturase (delta-4 desaturase)
MAPDADKLRQRRGNAESPTQAAVPERICSLANLKSTEVAIDSIIYDLTSFDHPGGDSVHVFGGNDVTVQYRMIHPYHTDKHLEKMRRVGKVVDFKPE